MPLSRDYNKADLNPIGFEQDKAIPAFSGTRSMSDVNTKQQLMNRISELERRNAELEALDSAAPISRRGAPGLGNEVPIVGSIGRRRDNLDQ